MAAPSTAYSSYKLPISGSTTTALPLALNLSSYPDLKSTFFLDGVLRVEDDFFGMVKSGSTMYGYHNTSRYSRVRLIDESNGDIYLLCNDGGLNTKPNVGDNSILNSEIYSSSISSNFKSSFYANTTDYGFRFREKNHLTNVWGNWNEDSMASQGVILNNSNNIVNSYSYNSNPKNPVQFQPFITNEEGTTLGQIVEFIPMAIPLQLHEGTFNSAPTTYFADTIDLNPSTTLYNYADWTSTKKTDGEELWLWVDDRYKWVFRYSTINDNHYFVELIDANPPLPLIPVSFYYNGRSFDSQEDADWEAEFDTGRHEGTLYKDESTGRWWLYYSGTSPNYTFSGVPDTAYYSSGDSNGVTGRLYLIDGYEQ